MSTIPYRRQGRLHGGQIAAVAATVGLVALGAFQLSLVFGAPLGHAAWGGDSADLTAAQRIGSGVSVAVYAVAALLVLARAGLAKRPRSPRLLKWGPWSLAIVFAVSATANFASRSHWEAYVLGPVALVLAGLCAAVGRTALQPLDRVGNPDSSRVRIGEL